MAKNREELERELEKLAKDAEEMGEKETASTLYLVLASFIEGSSRLINAAFKGFMKQARERAEKIKKSKGDWQA